MAIQLTELAGRQNVIFSDIITESVLSVISSDSAATRAVWELYE